MCVSRGTVNRFHEPSQNRPLPHVLTALYSRNTRRFVNAPYRLLFFCFFCSVNCTVPALPCAGGAAPYLARKRAMSSAHSATCSCNRLSTYLILRANSFCSASDASWNCSAVRRHNSAFDLTACTLPSVSEYHAENSSNSCARIPVTKRTSMTSTDRHQRKTNCMQYSTQREPEDE